MEDNRRRINEALLEEIESFDGDNFTQKLLAWKLDAVENQEDTDTLSKEDVRKAVQEALPAGAFR